MLTSGIFKKANESPRTGRLAFWIAPLGWKCSNELSDAWPASMMLAHTWINYICNCLQGRSADPRNAEMSEQQYLPSGTHIYWGERQAKIFTVSVMSTITQVSTSTVSTCKCQSINFPLSLLCPGTRHPERPHSTLNPCWGGFAGVTW